MTRWQVVTEGEGWSVIKVAGDGTITFPRQRWVGLSCIDAQVIAAELNEAHKLGRIEAIEAMRKQVFED